MARAALSSEQIAEFRGRAVREATRLFASDGFTAVSMRALGTALGVSPMTPYRYFENKNELFAWVRADAFQRFGQQQLVAAEGREDPVERLRALGAAYVDFARSDPDAYRIMFELRQETIVRHPELEAHARCAFEPLREAAEEAVRRGQLAGDGLSQAHLMWATIHGLVTLHLAGKLAMGRGLEQLAGEYFDQLFGAIRTKRKTK